MTRPASLALAAAALAAAFGAGWLVRDVTSPDPTTDGTGSGEPSPSGPDRGSREPAPSSPNPDARGDSERSGGDLEGSPRDRPATGAAPARNEVAAPAPPDDARRAGRAAPPGPPGPLTVAQFAAAIAGEYDRARPEGLRPTPADLDAAAQRARAGAESQVLAAATAAESHVRAQVQALHKVLSLRTARGVLGEGPAVLELRAVGRATVEGSSMPGTLSQPDWDPFAVAPPPRDAVGISGGVLLPGTAFVVDRVEIEAKVGDSQSRNGKLTVATGTMRLDAPGRLPRMRATFTGAEIVTDPGRLRLSVEDTAARARFVGRVVPVASQPEARPLVWTPDGAEGFLRADRPVRLQIAADHGGGNPRRVDLAGRGNDRFDGLADRPVWNDSESPRSIDRSKWWSEGAGLVPPGHVFRIQRIDWRARLEPDHKSIRFDIRCDALPKDKWIVRTAATETDVVSGTWTGDVAIGPGDEDDLAVTCHMYGFAEVTVYGRLEHAPR